jgi:hypothetical protein
MEFGLDIKQLRALLAISETGSVSRGGGNPARCDRFIVDAGSNEP